VGTAFLSQFQVGCKLRAGPLELLVRSVESDTCCTVAPAERSIRDASYKVLPKVDQADTFTEVHAALLAGACVGIFPEGGSHDQTGLLELKPGVAMMALGAMNAGSAPVQIVPCGITYFEAHRFRSRAVVEFGHAIQVSTDLAARYGSDKRASNCLALLHWPSGDQLFLPLQRGCSATEDGKPAGSPDPYAPVMQDSLNAVVPRAADYAELQALITMKALYKPRDHRLTPEESLQLTKSLALAATQFRDDEQMREVVHLVQEYNELLRAAGIRDRDVRRSMAGRNFTLRTVSALMQVLLLAPLALPSMLLFLPLALLTSSMAERERVKALASSSVKVKAMDVVASYKILVSLVFVPIYNLFIAIVVTWLSGAPIWFFLLSYFLLQLPAEYLLILVCDQFVRCARHCRASLRFVGGRAASSRLEERRAELQLRVRRLVGELGPRLQPDLEALLSIKQHSQQSLQRDDLQLGDACRVPSVEAEDLAVLLLPGTGTAATDPLLARAA